jgi:hypothetical protein
VLAKGKHQVEFDINGVYAKCPTIFQNFRYWADRYVRAAQAKPAYNNSTAMPAATVSPLALEPSGYVRKALGIGVGSPYAMQSGTPTPGPGLLPPAGYSKRGFADAVVGGCLTSAATMSSIALVMAPYTEGISLASVPGAAFDGCMNGAGGAMILYALAGDGLVSDTSSINDVREYLVKTLR